MRFLFKGVQGMFIRIFQFIWCLPRKKTLRHHQRHFRLFRPPKSLLFWCRNRQSCRTHTSRLPAVGGAERVLAMTPRPRTGPLNRLFFGTERNQILGFTFTISYNFVCFICQVKPLEKKAPEHEHASKVSCQKKG